MNSNDFSQSENETSTKKNRKNQGISQESPSEWDLQTIDFCVKIGESGESGEINMLEESSSRRRERPVRRRTLGEREQEKESQIVAPQNSLSTNNYSKFRNHSNSKIGR